MSIEENEGLLYGLTLESLMKRLRSEDCTAADINAARSFIKDHSIQGGSTMKQAEEALVFELPEFTVLGEEIEDNGRTGTDC